jgi:hypothetical protein
VTAIALANQLNPNVVRRWLRESRRSQPVPVETDVACHHCLKIEKFAL